MKKGILVCLQVVFVAVGASGVKAQGPPPPATYEQTAQRVWENLHNKILDMVKDFPEEKYDTHPGDDTRDFVGEIRHIMTAMDSTTANLKGEQFNAQERTKYYEGRPKTREALVADYEASMKACLEAIKAHPSPRVINLSEHDGEHYGKLVSIYRVSGLVPPTTRARQERQRQQQKQ